MKTCSFCKELAIDSCDFEAGNNAEVGIMANLCEHHVSELETLGVDFESKYAEILEKIASEKLVDLGEYYADR